MPIDDEAKQQIEALRVEVTGKLISLDLKVSRAITILNGDSDIGLFGLRSRIEKLEASQEQWSKEREAQANQITGRDRVLNWEIRFLGVGTLAGIIALLDRLFGLLHR